MLTDLSFRKYKLNICQFRLSARQMKRRGIGISDSYGVWLY